MTKFIRLVQADKFQSCCR